MQQKYHADNVALMTREFEQGLWAWDPEFSFQMLEDSPIEANQQITEDE
jgi:hypothetical protein